MPHSAVDWFLIVFSRQGNDDWAKPNLIKWWTWSLRPDFTGKYFPYVDHVCTRWAVWHQDDYSLHTLLNQSKPVQTLAKGFSQLGSGACTELRVYLLVFSLHGLQTAQELLAYFFSVWGFVPAACGIQVLDSKLILNSLHYNWAYLDSDWIRGKNKVTCKTESPNEPTLRRFIRTLSSVDWLLLLVSSYPNWGPAW